MGIVAITQPIPVVVIIGVTSLFLLLSLFHPIAALVVLLILGPMRVLISTEAAFQLPLDIGQLALILFLAVWIVHRIIHSGTKPLSMKMLWTPISGSLLFFLIATGISAFVATSLTAWALEWVKWVLVFVTFTVVVTIFQGISWEWLVFALVLSGVANALVGIYEFFGGSGALHLLINDRFFRAFGTFGQPNPFGGFMGLLIPISVMSAIGYLHRWLRNRNPWNLSLGVYYAISSALLLTAIGMSWSRGAWLGLGMALLVMGFFIPRKTRNGLLLFVVIAIGAVIIWFSGLLPQSIVQRLQTSTEEFFAFEDVRGVDITSENFAVAERLAHWQAAINMVTAHPYLGVGFGNYATVYPQYQLINWSEPLGHAHNYYLNIFAEVGILGLLGYGKVWITIFCQSWKATSHPDTLSRLVVIGLIGAWIYISVHSIFDNLYVNNLFLQIAVMLSVMVLLLKEAQINVRI
jgi:O-antigen ligase